MWSIQLLEYGCGDKIMVHWELTKKVIQDENQLLEAKQSDFYL